MKPLVVLSLFDGMACGYEALKRAGIPVKTYYASEVDKYAIQIAKKNHPDIIHLGDVTLWDFWDIEKPDLIIGGSPCQGFSFAGKQLAFDDPRSRLFFTMMDIIKYYKPKYKLLENVRMKKEYLDVITEYMGVEPHFINSALVSAQNRQRYYWYNWEAPDPKDCKITWGDIRQHGLNEHYYTEKGMQWLANHSRRKTKTLDVWQYDDKCQMIEASHYKNYSSQRFFGVPDLPSDENIIAAMRGRYIVDGKRQDGKCKIAGLTKQYIEFRYDAKTNAITTVNKDNVVVPFTLPNRISVDEFFWRYMSVIECERAQTLHDNYTEGVSNTQRYKMIGNGWTVEVIAHILEELKNKLK